MSDAAKISEMARDLRANSSQPGFYHALAAQIVGERATQAAQIEALTKAVESAEAAFRKSAGHEIDLRHRINERLLGSWVEHQQGAAYAAIASVLNAIDAARAALSNTGKK